jgi:hypothetical protein
MDQLEKDLQAYILKRIKQEIGKRISISKKKEQENK